MSMENIHDFGIEGQERPIWKLLNINCNIVLCISTKNACMLIKGLKD